MTDQRAAAGGEGHEFGGAWTEVKLETISLYLSYYNKVLSGKPTPERPFRRWYIDAFAGSGSRTAKIARGGLLEGTPIEVEDVELAGSARRALAADPPFDDLVFIEPHRRRFKDLERLRDSNPDRRIACYRGDANERLAELFGRPPWNTQAGARGSNRAVVFLDPYGMNVRWETLELLAKTRAADVWYLFPLEGVNRQLAHQLDRVDEHKQLKLDQIFGTSKWRQELYDVRLQPSLLEMMEPVSDRAVSKRQIETYALQRFQSIFSFVSEPLPLVNEMDRQLFSLICLANPETDKARELIEKGVKWVIKRQSEASHRKFVR